MALRAQPGQMTSVILWDSLHLRASWAPYLT